MAWLCATLRGSVRHAALTLGGRGGRQQALLGTSERALFASQTAALEPRETMDFDVCIVGAGPAGLSAAIKLKQVSSLPAISFCM